MNRKSMKIVLAAAGIVMVGMGVAFNAAAALGNDPVGIVYDGIRNTAQLSAGQLGMASNIVNIVLMILVFCLDRHYVNIGLAALLFGLFRALSNVYTGFDALVALKLPSTIYNMLPYIISLIVLVFVSGKSRAPKAEGIPYDKGQR